MLSCFFFAFICFPGGFSLRPALLIFFDEFQVLWRLASAGDDGLGFASIIASSSVVTITGPVLTFWQGIDPFWRLANVGEWWLDPFLISESSAIPEELVLF